MLRSSVEQETEKGGDAAADGGSRLRFAQDAHFVFRGVAMPLGPSHDFGVRMRGGRQGFGRDWRSTALRLATLAAASFRASPRPLRQHQENSCSSLFFSSSPCSLITTTGSVSEILARRAVAAVS